VALTFDDGYRDNLEIAAPALNELDLPATIFLLPELLDGDLDPWWERLAWAFARTSAPAVAFEDSLLPLGDAAAKASSLDRIEAQLKLRTDAERRSAVAQLAEALQPAGQYATGDLFLGWDGARDLVRAGIAIGSHTCGHAILARETVEDQRRDLRLSRKRLQDELGLAVDTLAYPNGQIGDYNAATVDAARSAGYANAVTAWGLVNRPGVDPFEVRRRIVTPLDAPARIVLGLARGVRRGRRNASPANPNVQAAAT
jgi:peptidoglycan/xylan/chitin deacetylase (PgdA/CDA1 family)